MFPPLQTAWTVVVAGFGISSLNVPADVKTWDPNTFEPPEQIEALILLWNIIWVEIQGPILTCLYLFLLLNLAKEIEDEVINMRFL